jgi:hypothetical protein
VLDAHVTGLGGPDRRIDVLAAAIAGTLTIDDLAEPIATPMPAATAFLIASGLATIGAVVR